MSLSIDAFKAAYTTQLDNAINGYSPSPQIAQMRTAIKHMLFEALSGDETAVGFGCKEVSINNVKKIQAVFFARLDSITVGGKHPHKTTAKGHAATPAAAMPQTIISGKMATAAKTAFSNVKLTK